jgi:2-amino-4-hydroxy-6-hydroxymethyldihydropteridine diphosphokinase
MLQEKISFSWSKLKNHLRPQAVLQKVDEHPEGASHLANLPMVKRELIDAYVGLGANLGDSRRQLESAILSLTHLPHTLLVAHSSFYRSAPFEADGPDYVNAVVHIQTRLNACELLAAFQNIENLSGRVRPYPNAPRTLDIDLLLYGAGTIQSSVLQVPHPRMKERAFVLMPLREIAPHLVSASEIVKVADQAIWPL